jgi:hypothetical protein
VGIRAQDPKMWGELLEKLAIIKGLVSYRGDSPGVPKSLVKKSTPT